MPTLKQPISDVLSRLSSFQIMNAEQVLAPLYARIWNNQLQDEMTGKLYAFPRPAAFLEIITPAIYEIIGAGYRSADLSLRIHLIHDFYNTDGTFEQDLSIFDLRDSIISLMHLYCPTGCGPLTAVKEDQQYDHNNLYHYVIDFVCNYTDDVGNVYKNYVDSAPPTNLQIVKPA